MIKRLVLFLTNRRRYHHLADGSSLTPRSVCGRKGRLEGLFNKVTCPYCLRSLGKDTYAYELRQDWDKQVKLHYGQAKT